MLASSEKNVGLLITLNQQALTPQGAEVALPIQTGQTKALLSVMPLKKPESQPNTGEFNASATLVLRLP